MIGDREAESYRLQGAERRERQIIEWLELMAERTTLGSFVKATFMSAAEGIRKGDHIPKVRP